MTGTPRCRFAAFAFLWAAAIAYSSLIIGPVGFHYVAIGMAQAWQKFLATPYVHYGSDQRADWVGNLMMLAPLGYLTTGVAAVGAGRARAWLSSGAAWTICFIFILLVKYGQLFVPPRTVTWNYIMAQAIGATLGIGLFWLSHKRLLPASRRIALEGDGLTVILAIYSVVLVGYFLMPFDFVMSADDLFVRLMQLPAMLLALPGKGHPAGFRMLLIVADMLAMVPVGMLLAVTGRQHSFRGLMLRGLGLVLSVTILTMFVLSASPFIVALLYRMAGIALGLSFMQRIKGKDLRRRHYRFARFVPVAFIIYGIALMFVSGLLNSRWRSFAEAQLALDPRGFLPFWHYYIVSKAHAAQSLVVHGLLFAPVGAMIWVRRGFWAKGALFSAIVAFGLSLLMEVGRWMKPGLQPDFSDPIIAAAAAAAMFRLMPTLWRMFEREAIMGASLDAQVGRGRAAAGVAAPDAVPAQIG